MCTENEFVRNTYFQDKCTAQLLHQLAVKTMPPDMLTADRSNSSTSTPSTQYEICVM